MRTPGRLARRSSALLVGPALLIILGCGGDDLGTRYPVSGKVTYKGESVKKGVISFHPEDKEGRGATGQIEDGSYSLTTHTPGDGAFPGTYVVTVDTKEVDEAAQKAAIEKFAQKKKIEGLMEVPQEVQGQLYSKAKTSTPLKYMAPQSSDLKTTVEAHTNKLDFDLKD
jgi:hypothetical protein